MFDRASDFGRFAFLAIAPFLLAALGPPRVKAETLQDQLGKLDSNAIAAADRVAASRTVQTNAARRLKEANAESSRHWRAISSRQEWEAFRAEKLAALAKSLGSIPNAGTTPRTINSGQLAGDGFVGGIL